ncbi:hypothetical protein, partial [Halomicrococcus sp. NG-SE-24]|uniref:hypothetical protein n=1 Tax=Halomicrococcus sp. NG-SE-24 TaxID=3436928 RepID=UPI003D99FE1C
IGNLELASERGLVPSSRIHPAAKAAGILLEAPSPTPEATQVSRLEAVVFAVHVVLQERFNGGRHLT